MAPPLPARELRLLDPQVWRACAGTDVRIPAAGSRVYYFPQGHAEQATSPPDFSALARRIPLALCRIVTVNFLANPDTDEVFTKMLLDPRPFSAPASAPAPEAASLEEPDEPGLASFAKILTASDANNGGGFSVPRFCADSIFPPLDFAADPPLQTISVRDVHGTVWNFRHIYRGTPRRHLLTTGWSKFVNSKKLVAGDSVVFIRNRAGELFVGVRRRSCISSSDYLRYNPLAAPPVAVGEGFSRNVKGRVPPGSVVEAVRLAEMNRPFEVVHYPRAGSPDFVVRAEVVETATRVCWTAGMRVKMSVETEDSSRMTWFQGTVSSKTVQDPGLWPGSPWRMLQVSWDEPEVLKNVKSVNPWQVELSSTTHHIQVPYPTIKKLRVSPSSELTNDVEGSMYFPVTGFNSTMMGSVTPSLINYNIFPAGMQGARHDSSSESNLSSFAYKNIHKLYSDNLDGNKTPEKLVDVSTELSIGSTSQSESSSPQSQSSSIRYYGTELFGTTISNATRKSRGSFQLFGRIIEIEQPFDAEADKEHKEVDGSVRSVDFSLPYHQKQLLNNLDVQRQRVSALEACFL